MVNNQFKGMYLPKFYASMIIDITLGLKAESKDNDLKEFLSMLGFKQNFIDIVLHKHFKLNHKEIIRQIDESNNCDEREVIKIFLVQVIEDNIHLTIDRKQGCCN